MSRLSQQGRRKWRSRVAKERAKIRARRIFVKRVRAARDAMMAFYREHIGKSISLFDSIMKPLADANGFQKMAEHAPATGAQIHAEGERIKVSQLQDAIAPGEQCESCGAGPPLFEHVYTDCTMRFCSRCKADAIDKDNDHDG